MPDKANCSDRCPLCGHDLHFGHAFGGVSVFSCPGCRIRWEQRLDNLFYRSGVYGPGFPAYSGDVLQPLHLACQDGLQLLSGSDALAILERFNQATPADRARVEELRDTVQEALATCRKEG